jgi:hypothetical protein
VLKIKKQMINISALVFVVLLIAMTGVAMADQPVPAVPETQTITTATTNIADGLVMEADALTWSISNLSLADRTTDGTPMLQIGQIQYTTAYDANIVGQAGQTTLVKTMAIDTRNKVVSQHNVKADTQVTFIATADAGNIVGSENIMLDGAGQNTTASDRMLCPFSAYPTDLIPAYCNVVQMGSKYDLVVGSVVTSASDPFVASDATVPVDMNYLINVKPYGTSQGQIPAMGSAMAYVKLHIQEARVAPSLTLVGRGANEGPIYGLFPAKSEDLIYNEVTSAQGVITAFNKVMVYQSGKSLVV